MWSLTTLFSSSFILLNLPAVLSTAVPSSTATASSTATTSDASVDMVAGAWFAGWHATDGFAVSNVSWDKYTHMTYSFA